MAEKRKSERSRTFFGAVIAFNQRKSTMNCNVRNFSPAGVAFLSEYEQDNRPVPSEFARRLRESEAEKAALRRRIAQLTESNCA